MARINQLETGVFVASQLSQSDFADIAAMGFRSVVANRPDGEVDGQLPHDRADAAARRQGLEFRYQPVPGFNVTDDDAVDAFAELMRDLPGPVLFYCGTGTRAAILWALNAVDRLGVVRTMKIAADAGYDLENIRSFLDERAGAIAA